MSRRYFTYYRLALCLSVICAALSFPVTAQAGSSVKTSIHSTHSKGVTVYRGHHNRLNHKAISERRAATARLASLERQIAENQGQIRSQSRQLDRIQDQLAQSQMTTSRARPDRSNRFYGRVGFAPNRVFFGRRVRGSKGGGISVRFNARPAGGR